MAPTTWRDGTLRPAHAIVLPAPSHLERGRFSRKVRYRCGLFGHHVHQVTERDGFTEYTCFCGHSFLKTGQVARKVRHPLVCFFTAHRIRFVVRRGGFAEYVCRDCGHPFCFADAAQTADVTDPATCRHLRLC